MGFSKDRCDALWGHMDWYQGVGGPPSVLPYTSCQNACVDQGFYSSESHPQELHVIEQKIAFLSIVKSIWWQLPALARSLPVEGVGTMRWKVLASQLW